MSTGPLYLSHFIFYTMVIGVVLYFSAPLIERFFCWINMKRGQKRVVEEIERKFPNQVIKNFVVNFRISSFRITFLNGEEHSFCFYPEILFRRSWEEQLNMQKESFQAALVAMDLKESEFTDFVRSLHYLKEEYKPYFSQWEIIFKDSSCKVKV